MIEFPWMIRIALFLLTLTAYAGDITGIWTGQQQGRRGEPEDVSFRFKGEGQKLTGKLLGDEFDIPIADARLTPGEIRFTVTIINYYSGSKSVFTYTGTVNGNEMELVRERVPTPEDKASNRPPFKQTIKLKKLA